MFELQKGRVGVRVGLGSELSDVGVVGADFLAVSAGVWAHPQGPDAAVAALNAAIAEGLAARN